VLEKALGSGAISLVPHQNIQHNAVLIHRTPQIVQRPRMRMNTSSRCQVSPGGGRPAPAQPSSEVGTELRAPMPNAVAGNQDAPFGQDQLDIT